MGEAAIPANSFLQPGFNCQPLGQPAPGTIMAQWSRFTEHLPTAGSDNRGWLKSWEQNVALNVCHQERSVFQANAAWRKQDEEKIETFPPPGLLSPGKTQTFLLHAGLDLSPVPFCASRAAFSRADLETSVAAASVFSWPNCPGAWWVGAARTNTSQKHLFLCTSQISVEMSSWAGKLGCPGQTSGSDLRWHFNPGQEQFVPGHNFNWRRFHTGNLWGF